MKREIQTNKPGTTIKSPPHSKTFENEFARSMAKMVEAISKAFENQVLKEMNKTTLGKFEDAQTGNFANVYLKLSDAAKRKLLKRFDDDRIESFTRKLFNRADKVASKTLYGRVENEIGISSKELLNTEGLRYNMNALVLESAQWAEKLRDDVLESFTASSLRAMTHGDKIEEILNQHRENTKGRKNHAQFVARNQLANFNSISTKIRAQNLGITEAKWITARGESRLGNPVRKCHAVRDGKVFDLSKGLYSSCDGKFLLPGVDYNCRCTYDLIIPME